MTICVVDYTSFRIPASKCIAAVFILASSAPITETLSTKSGLSESSEYNPYSTATVSRKVMIWSLSLLMSFSSFVVRLRENSMGQRHNSFGPCRATGRLGALGAPARDRSESVKNPVGFGAPVHPFAFGAAPLGAGVVAPPTRVNFGWNGGVVHPCRFVDLT